MAKINEEILVIKISTLLPDNSEVTNIMNADNVQALKAIIEQMSSDSRTLVEIEQA